MRRLAVTAAVCAALITPTAAVAAPPNPFGHPCTRQNGTLFCPSATLDDRVASWDGVPIDVDLTLPENGDGPFPTIVMVHGLGGSKAAFEAADENGTDANGGPHVQNFHYNNVFYAKRGYAVLNISQRGYGNSCGKAESRTSPGCDRGWQHLDDQAYEARDIQHLLGLLVDQGVTQPGGIGVTGISYGGGMSNILAYLRDRIRLPQGSLVAWKSPNGKALAINAAWSRWGWADLSYSLSPNGRFLESKKWKLGQAVKPVGILKKSFVDGLYLITTLNFIAPVGADTNAALTEAKQEFDEGEPYGTGARLVGGLLSSRKSPAGLFGDTPAPLLAQSGWADDLFPATESLMIYNDTNQGRKGPVSLQLADTGHGRGAVKAGQEQFLNDQGAAFFDAYLKKQGTPPAAGSITAFTQTCPNTIHAGGPIQSASWAKIHPGTFRVFDAKARRLSSEGGDPDSAKAFDKVLGNDPCGTTPAGTGKGTALYSAKVKKGFTLLGLPLIKATVKTKGRNGYIAARLYDVTAGEETLVSRGQYRLLDNQKSGVTFQLNGNGYRFAKGHQVVLELMGQDPNYLRKSNSKFTVTLKKLTLSLPTRERKPA